MTHAPRAARRARVRRTPPRRPHGVRSFPTPDLELDGASCRRESSTAGMPARSSSAGWWGCAGRSSSCSGPRCPSARRFLDFHVRYAIALPVIALVIAFNAVMHRRLAAANVTPREVALGVAVDLVAIGALLAASGGAANPLSAVFFVHVALAASLLRRAPPSRWRPWRPASSPRCSQLPSGACCPSHPANGAFSTHLYGMWAAFVIASAWWPTSSRGCGARWTSAGGRSPGCGAGPRRSTASPRWARSPAGTAHELATPGSPPSPCWPVRSRAPPSPRRWRTPPRSPRRWRAAGTSSRGCRRAWPPRGQQRGRRRAPRSRPPWTRGGAPTPAPP